MSDIDKAFPEAGSDTTSRLADIERRLSMVEKKAAMIEGNGAVILSGKRVVVDSSCSLADIVRRVQALEDAE